MFFEENIRRAVENYTRSLVESLNLEVLVSLLIKIIENSLECILTSLIWSFSLLAIIHFCYPVFGYWNRFMKVTQPANFTTEITNNIQKYVIDILINDAVICEKKITTCHLAYLNWIFNEEITISSLYVHNYNARALIT